MNSVSPDLPASLFGELERVGDLVTDAAVLEGYRRDQAAPAIVGAGMPLALLRPRKTADVSAALRVAHRHGVPTVPRGAGSGLSGGANATDGCLLLSLEGMDSIVDLDPDALTATVGPGVINAALRSAADAEGLFYAPDPASFEFSTLGGNVATNAGGLCCVKYGVTRDALLEVELVFADGRVARFGRRTRKGVTGYDLTSLVCGSEGTLGVITEATVRLLPKPAPAHTLAATFPSLEAAGDAAARICRRRRPSLLEIVDRTTMAAVEAFRPMELDLDHEAMLFARSDAGGQQSAEDIEGMERTCVESGADLVVTSDEEAEGRMLLAARRLAYTALEHTGATLLDDVAVPIPALPALLRSIEAISRRHDLVIGTFGHAGDGNMHPTIVYDKDDADSVRRAESAFDAILDAAVGLGGTVTGEHGVGLLKVAGARAELKDSLDLHQAIKDAWDPAGLMNPGKLL